MVTKMYKDILALCNEISINQSGDSDNAMISLSDSIIFFYLNRSVFTREVLMVTAQEEKGGAGARTKLFRIHLPKIFR